MVLETLEALIAEQRPDAAASGRPRMGAATAISSNTIAKRMNDKAAPSGQ